MDPDDRSSEHMDESLGESERIPVSPPLASPGDARSPPESRLASRPPPLVPSNPQSSSSPDLPLEMSASLSASKSETGYLKKVKSPNKQMGKSLSQLQSTPSASSNLSHSISKRSAAAADVPGASQPSPKSRGSKAPSALSPSFDSRQKMAPPAPTALSEIVAPTPGRLVNRDRSRHDVSSANGGGIGAGSLEASFSALFEEYASPGGYITGTDLADILDRLGLPCDVATIEATLSCEWTEVDYDSAMEVLSLLLKSSSDPNSASRAEAISVRYTVPISALGYLRKKITCSTNPNEDYDIVSFADFDLKPRQLLITSTTLLMLVVGVSIIFLIQSLWVTQARDAAFFGMRDLGDALIGFVSGYEKQMMSSSGTEMAAFGTALALYQDQQGIVRHDHHLRRMRLDATFMSEVMNSVTMDRPRDSEGRSMRIALSAVARKFLMEQKKPLGAFNISQVSSNIAFPTTDTNLSPWNWIDAAMTDLLSRAAALTAQTAGNMNVRRRFAVVVEPLFPRGGGVPADEAVLPKITFFRSVTKDSGLPTDCHPSSVVASTIARDKTTWRLDSPSPLNGTALNCWNQTWIKDLLRVGVIPPIPAPSVFRLPVEPVAAPASNEPIHTSIRLECRATIGGLQVEGECVTLASSKFKRTMTGAPASSASAMANYSFRGAALCLLSWADDVVAEAQQRELRFQIQRTVTEASAFLSSDGVTDNYLVKINPFSNLSLAGSTATQALLPASARLPLFTSRGARGVELQWFPLVAGERGNSAPGFTIADSFCSLSGMPNCTAFTTAIESVLAMAEDEANNRNRSLTVKLLSTDPALTDGSLVAQIQGNVWTQTAIVEVFRSDRWLEKFRSQFSSTYEALNLARIAQGATTELSIFVFNKTVNDFVQLNRIAFPDRCIDECIRTPPAMENVKNIFSSRKSFFSITPDYRPSPVMGGGGGGFDFSKSIVLVERDVLDIRQSILTTVAAMLDDYNHDVTDESEVLIFHRAKVPLTSRFDPTLPCTVNVTCITSRTLVGKIPYRSDCFDCIPSIDLLQEKLLLAENKTSAPGGTTTTSPDTVEPIEFLDAPSLLGSCNWNCTIEAIEQNPVALFREIQSSTEETGEFDAMDYRLRRTLGVFGLLRNFSSYLVLKRDYHQVFDPVTRLVYISLGSSFGLVLLALMILFVLTRRLMNRIEESWLTYKGNIEREKQDFLRSVRGLLPPKYAHSIMSGTLLNVEVRELSVAFLELVGLDQRIAEWPQPATIRFLTYVSYIIDILACHHRVYRLQAVGDTNILLGGMCEVNDAGSMNPYLVPKEIVASIGSHHVIRLLRCIGSLYQCCSPRYAHFPHRCLEMEKAFGPEAYVMPDITDPVEQVGTIQMPSFRTGVHLGPALDCVVPQLNGSVHFDIFGSNVMSVARKIASGSKAESIRVSQTVAEFVKSCPENEKFHFGAPAPTTLMRGNTMSQPLVLQSMSRFPIPWSEWRELGIRFSKRRKVFASLGGTAGEVGDQRSQSGTHSSEGSSTNS
jgi:hypothetical protein